MRKSGLLHGELARALTAMGHGDLLVVADAGLPVPRGVPCIDLAVVPGLPPLDRVLAAILAELAVEEALLARETADRSPAMDRTLAGVLSSVPTSRVSHEELKELSRQAVAVVRTGECTPYANVVLKAGVTF